MACRFNLKAESSLGSFAGIEDLEHFDFFDRARSNEIGPRIDHLNLGNDRKNDLSAFIKEIEIQLQRRQAVHCAILRFQQKISVRRLAPSGSAISAGLNFVLMKC